MPIRHVVDAVRGAFGGDFAVLGAAVGDRAGRSLLFGLAVWWGTATFRKEDS